MADLERLLKPMSTPAKASTYTCALPSTCTVLFPLPSDPDTHPTTFALVVNLRKCVCRTIQLRTIAWRAPGDNPGGPIYAAANALCCSTCPLDVEGQSALRST